MKKFKRKNSKEGSYLFSFRLPMSVWAKVKSLAAEQEVNASHVIIETLRKEFGGSSAEDENRTSR